jgi:catechol 2,3-dioxygenase
MTSAAPRSLLPDAIRLGPVRLRVANAQRSGEWLARVLGLKSLGERAGRAVWGAEATTPLVELREHAGARSVPHGGRPGIYHYALLLPGRAELGSFLAHLERLGIEHGDSDHLVSEAIYLRDPDGITVEVYADRPRAAWVRNGEEVAIATLPLDHAGVLEAGAGAAWQGAPEATRMGHVHHFVGDLAAAERFYVGGLGFAVTSRTLRSALFVSAAGYHHHVGLNTWAAGRPPAGPDDAGLDEWSLIVPTAGELDAIARRLEAQGVQCEREGASLLATDAWGITVRVTAA